MGTATFCATKSRCPQRKQVMYRDKTLKKYLDDLAGRLPAPGGGSAAALTAGLGAGLISMVANFTLGNPKYTKAEDLVRNTLNQSEKLRVEFLNLVDLDVQAFKSKNLRSCLDVPLMVCRLCFEAIKLCPPLVTKGNKNLISDVAVAAVLLESAFASAYYNVEINLKFLKDRKLTTALRKEFSQKGKKIRDIRQKTEEKVGQIIRG